VYHLELRQFPHNLNRFNLEEGEVRAILYPWVAEQWVELEERKWSAHQAKLTILEGPELPLQALTVASASTATAAVPYRAARHRLLLIPLVGLTCSYLLTSKSPVTPMRVAAVARKNAACREGARQPLHDDPVRGFVRSRLGVAVAGQVTRPPRCRR